MKRDFSVKAIEVLPDGSEEILTRSDCHTMRLPFKYGWHHWDLYQGENKLASFENYWFAARTASSLNNMRFAELEAA